MSYSGTNDDDAQALKELFRRVLYGVHTSMPGVVKGFYKFKGIYVVTVQPVIQQIDTIDDVSSLRAIDPIPNVPICCPYSQTLKLSMTVPIQVGDEGMIHFSERSLDNWLDKGGVQAPAEPVQPRSHDLADAVFVPGIQAVPYPIENWSADAIEIRNEDATVALSVSADAVSMRSASQLVSLPGDGNVYIVGDIVHTGSLVSSGTITGVVDVDTGAGISLGTHLTTGVVPGGGLSGVPQ